VDPSSDPRLPAAAPSQEPDSSAPLVALLSDRYRIERELGAGGMAVVYLAVDLRHDRQVALKAFRPEVSARLGAERFLHEIRVTARLQHPGILPLFDSGDKAGLLYYVMPFVNGETLRQHLARERQLPVMEAVRISREVASALDYAHRQGVIHRDIKPENILLHDGRPMVADFGIALALSAAGGERLTQTGMALGTPQYMSPEQATAEREIDARADVYALGCVLYEMLAGEPPHTGPTFQAIIARVVAGRPRPVSECRPSVPPFVARSVEIALSSLPADRFTTAREFADALDPSAPHPEVQAPAAAATPRSRRLRLDLMVTGAALLAVGGVIGWSVARGRAPDSGLAMSSRLSMLASQPGSAGTTRQIAITPDGSRVVYLATGVGSGLRLMVHRLDQAAPQAIPGGDFAQNIHITPDGKRILFSSFGGPQRSLPLEGGTPVSGPSTVSTPFLAWDAGGAVWFNDPTTGALLQRRDTLTSPVEAFPRDSASQLRIQQVLPDGRSALVVQLAPGANSGPALTLDLRTGARRQVLDIPVVETRFAAGYLLYVRPDASLHAVRFDAARLAASGTPVQLADDVFLSGTGLAQFAVAPVGTVVYLPREPRELVLVNRSGTVRLATGLRRSFHAPQFSPDGRRIAMDFPSEDGRDCWVLDLDQGTLTRVTFARDGHDPVWTPDGRSMTYTSQRGGAPGVYRVALSGGGDPVPLVSASQLAYTGRWQPGAERLVSVASELTARSGYDLVATSAGGAGPLKPLLATSYGEGWPSISPDGKWLAYVSNASGQAEVYARPLEGDGPQVQVSLDGGSEPVWARSGSEIFYRREQSGGVVMMAAGVSTQAGIRVLGRRVLFPAEDFDPAQPHANYDVSPDGQTFVMIRRSAASRLVVIQNFPRLMR